MKLRIVEENTCGRCLYFIEERWFFIWCCISEDRFVDLIGNLYNRSSGIARQSTELQTVINGINAIKMEKKSKNQKYSTKIVEYFTI